MIDHKNKPRPLSPHLTIYKAEYSSMLSIYHRVTGILLAVCLLFLGLIYKLQSYNIEYFSLFVNLFSFSNWSQTNIVVFLINVIIMFIIFAIVFMLSYHMSNGIRHFIWDYVLSTVSKSNVKLTSYMVMILTAVIFIVLVLPAYF